MKRSLLLGAVLLMAGCFSAYDTPKPGEMRVRRGNFTSTMVLTGELEAARGAMVSVPELPSWQSSIKWLIDDGVAVKAGERVAELDNTPFTADLDKKRQDLTQAEQELQEKAAEWVGDLRDKQFDVEKKKGDLDKAKIEAAVPKDIVSSRDYEDRCGRSQNEFCRYADLHSRAMGHAIAPRSTNIGCHRMPTPARCG